MRSFNLFVCLFSGRPPFGGGARARAVGIQHGHQVRPPGPREAAPRRHPPHPAGGGVPYLTRRRGHQGTVPTSAVWSPLAHFRLQRCAGLGERRKSECCVGGVGLCWVTVADRVPNGWLISARRWGPLRGTTTRKIDVLHAVYVCGRACGRGCVYSSSGAGETLGALLYGFCHPFKT